MIGILLDVPTIGEVFQQTGVAMTGSIILFAILLLAALIYFMATFNLPSKVMFPLFAIIAISMVVIWGGTTLRIIGFIVAFILAIMLAVNILNSFQGDR